MRESSTVAREPKLDPVRRPRPPRGRALLRASLVTALLLTAAGALYARDPSGCPPAMPSSPSPVPASSQPPAGSSQAPDGSSQASAGRLAVPTGTVGVPLRLSEPAVLALIHPGDRVDLLAAATPAATDALVLGVVEEDGAVLLALPPAEARSIVGMPATTRFTVMIR